LASVARADDLDEVCARILTGYRGGKPFTPYVPTVQLPAPIGRVLDLLTAVTTSSCPRRAPRPPAAPRD